MRKRVIYFEVFLVLLFVFAFVSTIVVTKMSNKNKKKFALIGRDGETKLESHKSSTDYMVTKDNNYLNFSNHYNDAGLAPEAKLELHLPDKQGLHRHPGLIPGWSAALC